MSRNSCWSSRRPCSTSATSFVVSSCSSAPEADSSATYIAASEGSLVLLARRGSNCSSVGTSPATASLWSCMETCCRSACTSAMRSRTQQPRPAATYAASRGPPTGREGRSWRTSLSFGSPRVNCEGPRGEGMRDGAPAKPGSRKTDRQPVFREPV